MRMSGGEDWLLRPVMEGLISYADLKGTRIDLYDIALMNEALEVRGENTYRITTSNRK